VIAKLFYLPVMLLALVGGVNGALMVLTLMVVSLPAAALLLEDPLRAHTLYCLTAVTLYTLLGLISFSEQARIDFERRCALISSGADLAGDVSESKGLLRRRLTRLLGLYGATIKSIRTSSEKTVDLVHESASQVSTNANGLARRAEEIAAMLEQTAAGMEEFALTIERSASSCQFAHDQSNEVLSLAQQGASSVTELAHQMGVAREFAQQITRMTAGIDEIAVQINILALNASIEAARAGEDGRAFAVVATEVRKLSLKTSTSTSTVRQFLEQSLLMVDTGQEMAKRATGSIQKIVEQTNSYSRFIGDIATSAAEQNAGVEQIKSAIEQMAHQTQKNVTDVTELSAVSGQLSTLANTYRDTMSRLHKIDLTLDDQAQSIKKITPAAKGAM
jgi:methyl-accepting chemotaxis protein